MKKKLWRYSLTTCAFFLFVANAQANCTGIIGGNTIIGYDTDTVPMGIGRINIVSTYLQPVGTILATGLTNYSGTLNGGLSTVGDDGVVLTCDNASDADKLSWVFATNGDSIIGGYYEVPGYPGYYATQFPYVAIKLNLADTGQTFSRTWAKSSKKIVLEELNGKFVLRKRDIPKISASVIKWANNDTATIKDDAYAPNDPGVKAHYCRSTQGLPGSTYAGETNIPIKPDPSNPDLVWTADYNTVPGAVQYSGCGQPNGYIYLAGAYYSSTDYLGQDSNNTYVGFEKWIPVGLNGSPAATFSYAPSCVVRTVTPYVVFPTMSVSQITNGEIASRNFNVALECDDGISTTPSLTSVSVGLQPSLGAFNNAQNLGLIDATTGAITYLVSDNYTDSTMAKGVGISLKNGDGNSINFVSWTGCGQITTVDYGGGVRGKSSTCTQFSSFAQMRAAGWDPVMSNSTSVSKNPTQATTVYTKSYIATLSKLPGLTPTAGRIKATATVQVRYP